MKQRSTQLELMDLGPDHYTISEYYDCLKKLDIIGFILSSDMATFRTLKKLSYKPASILDVGCGGGKFTMRLAKKYPDAKVVGIDIDKNAIDYASKKYQLKNLSFQHRVNPELNEPENSFDIVTSTLVCHHLKDEVLVDFIKRSMKVAKKTIIINDLQRSRIAYGLFRIIVPFFNNRMLTYDGLLSIKRAFIKDDFKKYLKLAGVSQGDYKIVWHWAFRWLVTINL